MEYDPCISLSGVLSGQWTRGGPGKEVRATHNATERGKPTQGHIFELISLKTIKALSPDTLAMCSQWL